MPNPQNAFDQNDNDGYGYHTAMPERPEDDVERAKRFLKALGAGAADPYGASSWTMQKMGMPDVATKLQELRGADRNAGNAGSIAALTLATLGGASLPGNLAAFGAKKGLQTWGKEILPMVGGVAVPFAGALSDITPYTNMRFPFTAQGRYQRDGN